MIELMVNGRTHAIDAEPDTPLLYVLRDDLQLNAAKFGCGLGQCGACTVLVDDAPALSCITPILLLPGRRITTLEGLGSLDRPAPIQQAFMEEQAAQCGFCIAGMMMRGQALLQRNASASDAEIRAYLEPNLCRCGTHMRILRAVRRAGELMRGASPVAGQGHGPDRRPDSADAQDGSQSAPGSDPEDLRPARRDAIRHAQERKRPER